ncbi:MAG: hypothetical protein KGI54_09550 [Pseudomonadota bacterium]|nr:hypothetical protein [Pseudomonadota bacterium]
MDEEVYMVFAGKKHYPQGGMLDFVGLFHSLSWGKSYVRGVMSGEGCDWAHIVSYPSLEMITSWNSCDEGWGWDE